MKTAAGYLVQGYKLVLAAGGTQTDIITAPAVADPTDGYLTAELATAANAGQSATFTTSSAGAIGIVTTDSTRFDNPDGNTIYELCYGNSSGGPHDSGDTGRTDLVRQALRRDSREDRRLGHGDAELAAVDDARRCRR